MNLLRLVLSVVQIRPTEDAVRQVIVPSALVQEHLSPHCFTADDPVQGSQHDLQEDVDTVLIRDGTTYVPARAGFGMERPA